MQAHDISSSKRLESFILLPEMVLRRQYPLGRWGIGFEVEKKTKSEFCPSCQRETTSVHSKHKAKIKDATIRGKCAVLFIIKKRYRCRPCDRIFTEHFPGIRPRKRHTQRFVREVKWASTTFSDMSSVQKHMRSSPATCFKARNDELSKKVRETSYALPEKIGIDEHSLRKPKYQATDYCTIVVDHKNKKVFDLIDSRTSAGVADLLSKCDGKENVKWVSMDFSTTYKSAVRQSLPNAQIVIDRFHAQRLFSRLVNKMRKKVTGDVRKNPVRKLLLRNACDLKRHERNVLHQWLNQTPQVKEVYEYKEAMRRVFRTKGVKLASKILTNLIDKMDRSENLLVKGLRKVIVSWRQEILNYHLGRISNGRVEGFNRKAKLIQRRGFGLKNFKNYRLVLLNACR